MSPFAPSQTLIEALSVAAIAYGSTNFDNLIVASAYAARSGYRSLLVQLTFIGVCLAVLLVSLALAQAAQALPAEKIRFLGLIPMGLGGYQLAMLIIGKATGERETMVEAQNPSGFSAYLGFALILLANSSDSVSVLTPLLADLNPSYVLASFLAATAVAVAMSALANSLGRHPMSRVVLDKIAKWILPFLLMAIGVLIVTDMPPGVFIE